MIRGCNNFVSFIFIGIDALHGGIATHYCESTRISELEQALVNLKNADDIENVLNKFCPKIDLEFSLARHLNQINRCFDASTIEAILSNLEKDDTAWARQTIMVNLSHFNSIKTFRHAFLLGI